MYRSEANALIPAQVGRVWGLIADDQNYPRFVGHLAVAEKLGDQTSCWYLQSPANLPLSWKVVRMVSPAREVAWHSLPGSASVKADGYVRLEPEGEGTRVSICYAYTPLGPAAKEALGSVFDNAGGVADQDLKALARLLEAQDAPEDEDADPVGTPAGGVGAKASATPNPLDSELVGKGVEQ